jgi:hypothetical protein
MKRPLMQLLALALASFSLTACAMTDSSSNDEQDSSSTAYVQIQDFGPNGADDAWYGITSTLNGQFNDVCGDTFCEGDFSNITPLRLFCSVTSKQGQIHDCAWTFTAGQHGIDPKLGAVAIDAVTYQCHFKPATTGTKLIALLQGSTDALHLALPGMGSIYDTLGDCFTHPIGATPISINPGTTYVDAESYYTTTTKWDAAVTALHSGFDNVCGDTFCGSDYSDVQSLDLGCAITKSTGNVKSCVWTFGGSYSSINKNGTLALGTKTWSCPVAVHGTLFQMLNALTNTGDPEPNAIQRLLPGGTSAYDSIAGCVTR